MQQVPSWYTVAIRIAIQESIFGRPSALCDLQNRVRSTAVRGLEAQAASVRRFVQGRWPFSSPGFAWEQKDRHQKMVPPPLTGQNCGRNWAYCRERFANDKSAWAGGIGAQVPGGLLRPISTGLG